MMLDQLLTNHPMTIALLTIIAGGAMPIGGALAYFEKIQTHWLKEEFRHSVIAFGGGALLSAVALVLVPEGIEQLPPLPVVILLFGGGITFMLIDILLEKLHSPAAQLLAMLSDFVPEALALGATFSTDGKLGPLLAILIAIQNLPEGFNAFRELTVEAKLRPKVVILSLVGLAFLGPVAGLSGYFFLAELQKVVAAIMLFASGGILYLTFQDIAPQARLEKHWAPPLGAIAGFSLGVVGKMVVG